MSGGDIVVQKTRSVAAGVLAASHVPSSPHTPLSRSVSASLYNSPSARFRIDDENLLIFEVGARVFRAGFAGESRPRCEISYSPEQLRRVGDYRQYAPDYDHQAGRRSRSSDDWACVGHQLWQPDLRDFDLNFIGERIERLVREVEITYLMLDTRPRKVGLVVSSQLPKLLLELTLSALFNVLQGPSVTILASNFMSVISSGLRSALVIDIGWSETTVSAIFEFREVSCYRTINAAKELTRKYAGILGDQDEMTLEAAEDLIVRLAWCQTREAAADTDKEATIEHKGRTFSIRRSTLSHLVEETFFASNTPDHAFDDHDLPIHLLAYKVMLRLPVDVRKVCMSRIVVVGGSSDIPGLKTRLIQALQHLISTRGWNPVKNNGSSTPKSWRQGDTFPTTTASSTDQPQNGSSKLSEHTTNPPEDLPAPPSIPAHLQPQEKDEFMDRITARNGTQPPDVQGVLRCVHSLGAWAGASLLTGLRVRGLVEIEREKFLSSGLTGALSKATTGGRVASGTADKAGTTMPNWL